MIKASRVQFASIGVAAFMATATFSPARAAQGPGASDAFRERVLPLLEKYCLDCHSKDDAEAGVVL